MKVLLIVHGFPPSGQGGAEIYAHAHASALRERHGDEVLVLTRDADSGRAEYDIRRHGHVVRVNNTFRDTRSFEGTYRNETIGAIACEILDDFRPDVAHVHHLTCLSTTIVRSLAERRIPCFFTLHDYWLMCHRGQLLNLDSAVCHGPDLDGRGEDVTCHSCLGPAGGTGPAGFTGARTLRFLERTLPADTADRMRHMATRWASTLASTPALNVEERRRLAHMRGVCADVTHFLAPSRHMRDRFVQFGIAPERITVAPYGFDHSRFRSISRTASSRLRLGFLGSLMISKAPHVLLEAVQHLRADRVSVDLFGAFAPYHGDDSYRHRLTPLLTQEHVRAHGAIPHDRVAEALSSIDVLVVPSIWPENSPLVVQEAFLAGVPVVASRIGGIPELVDEGRNGLLFCPGDSDDLARALQRLLHEQGLLDSLRAGIPAVRTLEKDVQLVRNLYQARLASATVPARERVAAVVLHYGAADDTWLAVRSLLASRRSIDEVIVVDNDGGGPDVETNRLRAALRGVGPRVTYVRQERNLGFSGGMNVGIRHALAGGADAVLLVNNDIIVPPDCLERLEHSLTAVPRAGIAGPMILARSEPDRVESLGLSYKRGSGRMRQRTARLPLTGGERFGVRTVDAVSGCLMLVRREVLETVGLLDEDYFFSFEDLDFCLRARRAGYVTVLCGLTSAYHEGSRSIGPETSRRLYYAARNHLLLALRVDPSAGPLRSLVRGAVIVALNLAHALRSGGGWLPARLGAVLAGTRDYATGRFGPH
jgi:GT2 family glycosyltransferase/glycosyltransferase involved in cell wall biosynthesis